MTRTGRIALLPVLLVLAAGCGAPAPSSSSVAVTTPAAAPAAVTPSPAAVPAAPEVAASWVMPDLVGRNLQDAQDAIQALTDFGIPIIRSHDATGAGRNQVLDSNWQVCDQNIAPGEEITAQSDIDLAAVKLDERC